MTAHFYTAFGLTLASDFRLDVLDPAPADAVPDLVVTRRSGLARAEHPPVDPVFDITPERQYLHWRAVGTFVIEDPARVAVEPQDGVTDHLVSQALLGLVISLVLERRGVLCLHAGAVAVRNRAAIFLGDKGAGKSTTCGALLARGHAALTDDLVAVDQADQATGALPSVRPGFSSMKLWPDAVSALALAEEAGDRLVHPSVGKLQKRLPVPVAPDPVPMGALFVLRRDDGVARPRAERLPPHEALQAVLRYTFMARYGETRLGRDHLARHLKRCGGIVARVPVHVLHVPADLARLDALAAEVERTLA